MEAILAGAVKEGLSGKHIVESHVRVQGEKTTNRET